MLSAPRRMSERVQRMQVGRQADKVPPREQGGERPEQERGHQAQTAPPLSDIPCPAGVRENTSSVSWGGERLQKIVSYKASKNLRENLGESSLLSNIWHRQWGWRVCLWPRLSYCCGPAWPTLGSSPAPPCSALKRGEQEAGVCLWASRCPWFPVWKLESLVMGGEERISKALGGGRVQWHLHHREFSRGATTAR